MPKTIYDYYLGRHSTNASVKRIFMFKSQQKYLDMRTFLLNDILGIINTEKNIISDNNNMSSGQTNCCCNGTITTLNDVNILNCNSNINITNIPSDSETQDKAEAIYGIYIVPSPQPTTIAGKAPLVFTKMFDKLLHSIYEEFITNPRIIRLFDAFNYATGSQMTMTQYDNIVRACVIFWRAKNLELLKKDPKLCFNFCVLDQLCGKFFVSYKPVVYENATLIDNFSDPNYGANGYTQWIGNYIGTKYVNGQTNGVKQHIYIDGYKFNSARALTEGQFIQTCGFQQKTRKLCTSFNGISGGDINFQWMIGEIDTVVSETTSVSSNTNTTTITEKNALGQSKISTTVRSGTTIGSGAITSMSVSYVDEFTYNAVQNFEL